MTTILVDRNSCTRCHICSSVCPMSIIEQNGSDSFPGIRDAGAEMCLLCGHCEVFCPSQSLRLNVRPDEKATLPAGAGTITPVDIGFYMKKRRSIRRFRKDPLPKQKILNILDTTRYAASAGNGQPVQWILVYDREKVRMIAGLTIEFMRTLVDSAHPMSGYAPVLIRAWEAGTDVICLGAPHLLLAHIPEENPVASVDAVIAMTHVDIAAPAFGMGTCWAGFVTMAIASHVPLRKELDLPAGRKCACAMMLGNPKYKVFGIPRRKPLKVTWI